MSTGTPVATSIQPEAAAHAARLGLQAELAEVLTYAKRGVPGLISLAVEYAPAYDSGNDGILILATREPTGPSNPECWEQFSAWKTARFPPEVWCHFNVIFSADNQHGG